MILLQKSQYFVEIFVTIVNDYHFLLLLLFLGPSSQWKISHVSGKIFYRIRVITFVTEGKGKILCQNSG
jgi:hypothetical protein